MLLVAQKKGLMLVCELFCLKKRVRSVESNRFHTLCELGMQENTFGYEKKELIVVCRPFTIVFQKGKER